MLYAIKTPKEHPLAIDYAPKVAILYVSRGCSGCRQQKPYYDKISKSPAAKDAGIVFFVMTETSKTESFMIKTLKLNWYPTLALYSGGKKVFERQNYMGYNAMLEQFRKHFKMA